MLFVIWVFPSFLRFFFGDFFFNSQLVRLGIRNGSCLRNRLARAERKVISLTLSPLSVAITAMSWATRPLRYSLLPPPSPPPPAHPSLSRAREPSLSILELSRKPLALKWIVGARSSARTESREHQQSTAQGARSRRSRVNSRPSSAKSRPSKKASASWSLALAKGNLQLS